MNAIRPSRFARIAALLAIGAAGPVLYGQQPKTTPPAATKPKTPAPPQAKPATQKKPAPAKPAPAKPAAPSAAPKEAPPAPKRGLTLVTTYTGADGQSSETKLITNGIRQRIELGDGTAVITQCDAKQVLQVNDKYKLYVAMPLDAPPVAASPAKKIGAVDYITAFTDSGEKKQIHGLEAKRVTTVVTRTPTPTSCDKKKERTQTDGWYAAVPVSLICASHASAPPPVASDCRDEPRTSSIGEPPAGKPLAYTVTTFNDDGKETASARMEIKELTVAAVDEALLDAPAGYTKTADPTDFVAAIDKAENEARWSAPKASGTVRIGVLMPVNKTAEDVSVIGLGNELLESLTVKAYEAVPILGASTAEQAAEAKAKEVDYLLAVDLTSLKTSTPSKVGGLVRKASGGGSPSELHEAKLEYRVFAAGSATPKATKSASAKTGSFTLKRAAGLAKFAARLYFGSSAGMFRTMLSQPSTQNADPSLGAVSYVLNLLGSGTPAAADESSREATIITALHNASNDILKDLGYKREK